MITIEALTFIHTGLSFIGLGLGFFAVRALFNPGLSRRWMSWFLLAATATSITGFLFPITTVTPAVATGVVALVTLAATYMALYAFKLKGLWRAVYAGGIVINHYLLVFVAIAQAFLKIGFLYNLAPTLSEPPFGISQTVAFLVFAAVGVKAVKRFKA